MPARGIFGDSDLPSESPPGAVTFAFTFSAVGVGILPTTDVDKSRPNMLDGPEPKVDETPSTVKAHRVQEYYACPNETTWLGACTSLAIMKAERSASGGMSKMAQRWIRHGWKKAAGLFSKADRETKKFPVLEGHPSAEEHAGRAKETQRTIEKSLKGLKKEFQIYRWSPEFPSKKPYLQSYFVDLSTCGPMVRLLLWTAPG